MQSIAWLLRIMELNMRIDSQWILTSCGIMMFVTFLVLTIRQPKLVVVDMTRVIELPAARLAHSTMPASKQAQLMTRFTKCLPDVIEQYAKAHHVTVISGKVLARENSLDVTRNIIELTLLRLKHEK